MFLYHYKFHPEKDSGSLCKGYVLISLVLLCFFHVCSGDCRLLTPADGHESKSTEEELLKRINPLKSRTFQVKDGEDDKYAYYITICDLVPGQNGSVGAVQHSPEKHNVSLGSYDMVDVMGGTNWIMLTYYNGTHYSKEHCGGAERTTKIVFVCDPDRVVDEFRILKEQRRSNTSDCFYLFELSTDVACNSNPPHSLSSGSVFCIIFFTMTGMYLLIGFVYQRLVIGAQGLEQIPNYTFWREFGNLQADGCDFLCRCGPRQESQAYRGIDDRLRADEERDDQLLNM